MNKYRKNVAVFVLNNSGCILICERVDVLGAWQLPQGGIEEGETPEDAMFRELHEEIGTNMVEVLGRLPQPIAYEWPEHLRDRGYLGQEQEYFLVRLKSAATINLAASCVPPEFRSYRWVGAQGFCEAVGGFKRQAYLNAIAQFQALYPTLISC